MADAEVLRQRYRDALESLLEKARQDPYIVGVVLLGSLSYATVWERSDIDLMLITQDVKLRIKSQILVEDQINIHASIITRSEFKRMVEGALGGSIIHSFLGHGTLVYSSDPTIDELFADRRRFGVRDQQIGQMRAFINILASLDKAQKWLVAKDDFDYAFVWTLHCLGAFSSLVLIRHGEIPDREAILHAARARPDLIDPLYHDLIHGPKEAPTLSRVLSDLETYLLESAPELCAPLFEYLAEEQVVRSASAVEDHFQENMGLQGAGFLCEWLADRGLLDKVSTPVRITEKSRIPFDEAAFYYDPS